MSLFLYLVSLSGLFKLHLNDLPVILDLILIALHSNPEEALHYLVLNATFLWKNY